MAGEDPSLAMPVSDWWTGEAGQSQNRKPLQICNTVVSEQWCPPHKEKPDAVKYDVPHKSWSLYKNV